MLQQYALRHITLPSVRFRASGLVCDIKNRICLPLVGLWYDTITNETPIRDFVRRPTDGARW